MTGRDRKNSLKALFGEPLPPAPETKSAEPVDGIQPAGTEQSPKGEAASVQRTSSGAVRAMGLSLSSITREAEEARALRQALEDGEKIVAMDTDKIDASFIADRLSEEDRDDPEFATLMESIRDNGQQVPILVRPHPQNRGRYQVAYGHRRLKAARRLGIAVKTIVRPLSDDELVLAQGKENAERRNLTFIERAIFAKALSDRGFDRKLTGDALAVQKSELSRLLQVAEAVPIDFVRAIGPAPKAGRERWMALGQLLATAQGLTRAQQEMGAAHFREADSDARFQLLFDRLSVKEKQEKPTPAEIRTADGRVLARVSRQGRGMRIDFPGDVDSGFLEALTARLAEDYQSFLQTEKD